jgi:hypothetical protein
LIGDEGFECLSHECAEIFKKAGFEIINRISIPLKTNSTDLEEAKEKRKMLNVDRVLWVFRKD